MKDKRILDDTYLPLIQPELAPAWIDYILRYHQHPLPRLAGTDSDTDTFHYIDLGCGYGLTILCLAAAYPNAYFTAIDANPVHIEFARGLAEKASLQNIDFLTARFSDSSLKQVSPAHYVVADGVYSWVPADTRNALVAAFDHLLLPGATAMVSTNLMPGALAFLPVRRILKEIQAASPGRSAKEVIRHSLPLIADMAKQSRSPFLRSAASAFEKNCRQSPVGFLIHEFLPDGWQPVWTAELVQHFASIGCQPAGETDPGQLHEDFALKRSHREILLKAATGAAGYTLRDSLAPRYFARFLFQRPAGKAGARAKDSRMSGWMALVAAPENVAYSCLCGAGKLTFDSPTAHRIVDILSHGPQPLSQIAAQAEPPDTRVFLRIIDSLCTARQLVPVDLFDDNPSIARLNQLIEENSLSSSYQATPHGTPMIKSH